MKKLKIFLLLGILLCFGFALSSEVHAQSDGPKLFEVGDVLPATTQLEITVISYYGRYGAVLSNNNNLRIVDWDFDDLNEIKILGEYKDFEGDGSVNTYIIDTSNWSLAERTISISRAIDEVFWEDVAPSVKIFEEGDVLPAGYIKISWDFTDKFNDIFDEYVSFYIYADGDPENTLFIEIRTEDYGEVVEMYINYEEFHIDTPGETVISIPIPYTVNQIDADGDYDYYVSVGDALMWEVVTEEDFIYDQAYQEGYSDGYYKGYEHARERYGYYDSRTDEWLTVSEYITRYGTDKPGQSDFYNNFDKYFIPAMIIVFGGAIVLTILKVFKGRE